MLGFSSLCQTRGLWCVQVAVRSERRTGLWVLLPLQKWWAVSLMWALSRHAAVRWAVPALLVAAVQAGRAQLSSTMAATSSWAASSSSSASQSLLTNCQKRSTPFFPLLAVQAPARAVAVWPALLLPPHQQQPALLWRAAPPARMRQTLRPLLPTKCPCCATTLFHNPHRTHACFVCTFCVTIRRKLPSRMVNREYFFPFQIVYICMNLKYYWQSLLFENDWQLLCFLFRPLGLWAKIIYLSSFIFHSIY